MGIEMNDQEIYEQEVLEIELKYLTEKRAKMLTELNLIEKDIEELSWDRIKDVVFHG